MPWKTETVTIGGVQRTFTVCIQESKESCGPACVAMVNQLRNGNSVNTSETIAKLWFAQIENRLGVGNTRPGSAIPRRVFDWNNVSQTDTIMRVLKARNIGNPRITTEVHEASGLAPHMPGIMRVQWVSGTGHFVVCVGEYDGVYVYLDPTHGVVESLKKPPYYIFERGGNFEAGVLTHLIAT